MIIPNPSLAMRPFQIIPESQKNNDWIAGTANWAISMSPFYRRTKEQKLYNRYNGKRDIDRFDHLSNTYGVEFPAGKVKHIPLIRPLLDRLYGQQQSRPWGNIVRSSDTDGQDKKTELLKDKILNDIIEAIKSDPDTSTDILLDKIEKYYKENFQTNFEIAAAHVLEDYRLKFGMDNLLWDSFLDKEITGRQYYHCRVNRVGEPPEVRNIRPGNLFYADNNVKWVKQCDWAVEPLRMSVSEIIDRWGDQLEKAEIDRLQSWVEMYTHDAYKVDSMREMDALLEGDAEDYLQSNRGYYNKINVYFVEFKASRKVSLLESTNKKDPDTPFIKYIPQDRLFEVPGARKKNIKTKYIQDLYQAVRIGDDMWVDLGKVKYPRRDPVHPSRVHLSFNGLTYNGKIKPHSLVEVTDELQDLYDIMHFHKENLIAMSGTKGSYMELSQLPDFGTGKFEDNLKMYLYYKKLGTAFIDRSQEGADTSFNTFPSYDDTLGAGLQVILKIIEHLEELASRIIGVPRQALGDIEQYDGKGNVQSALSNSALVTEPMFNEHDEFARQMCEDVINACKVSYRNGYQGSYVNSQFLQQIFTVDPEFSMHDYGVYMTNRMSDQNNIQEVKAYVGKLLEAGKLEFEDIMPLFRKSNLKDIDLTIKASIEQRRRLAEANASKIQQLQQQMAMEKQQAEVAKLQAEVVQLQAQAQSLLMGASLDERALQLEQAMEQKKLENDGRRVDLEQQQLIAAGRQGGRKSAEVRNK